MTPRLYERERKVEGYVGQVRVMNCGIPAKVIKYNSYIDIVVKFDTGEIRHCRVTNFLNGNVACRNDVDSISKETMKRLSMLAKYNNTTLDKCLSNILNEYNV
jgi:hypothetical protein